MPVYEILRASLPNFLGGIATTLALTAASWAAQKLRQRRGRDQPPSDGAA